MEKKITIYTVATLATEDTPSVSKAFTTKKLASDAQNTLKHFGVEVTLEKQSKTITLD